MDGFECNRFVVFSLKVPEYWEDCGGFHSYLFCADTIKEVDDRLHKEGCYDEVHLLDCKNQVWCGYSAPRPAKL